MFEKQDSSYLDVIRKKTENLPGFPQESIVVGSDFYKYKLNSDFCFAKPLFEEDNVSVAVWKMKAKTEFPAHRHDEKEWIIVYKGKLEIFIEDRGKFVLSKGDSIVIDPDVAHSMYYLVNTSCIAVTIPQSNDFPQEVSRDG